MIESIKRKHTKITDMLSAKKKKHCNTINNYYRLILTYPRRVSEGGFVFNTTEEHIM